VGRFIDSMWKYSTLVFSWLSAQSIAEAQLSLDGCSICPSSLPVVGLPDVVLPAGTAGVLLSDQTCAETDAKAQSGAYSQAQCVLLRASGVSNTCGCKEQGPTDKPVPPPTSRPVAPPVEKPAPVPTSRPVAAPTSPPVTAPIEPPVPPPTGVPFFFPPTGAPVPAPANVPVIAPQAAPVTAPVPTPVTLTVPTPTIATPTLAPVQYTPVSGSVSIRLQYLYSPWTNSSTETFIAACEEFYEAYLPGTVFNVSCAVSGAVTARRLHDQKRSQHVRSLQANQTIDVPTDVTALINQTVEVFDFQKELISTVTDNSTYFALLLRTRGDAVSQVYFKEVQTVNAFVPGFAPPIGAGPVAPVAAVPVAAVPSAPAPAVPSAPKAAPSAPKKDDDSLSKGALAGIAIGVAGGIGLVLALIMYAKSTNPDPSPRPVHTDPVGEDFPAPGARATSGFATSSTNVNEPAPSPPGAVVARSVVAAVAVARDGNSKDGMSVVTGSEMDAYSLDAGNVDQQSSAPGTKRDTVDGMSQSGDEMSSHAMSSLRQNMVSRTVIAPPGKLGIVIDTTLEGPVVHKINPQSPLEGVLFPGDIIVAIDDVDTRAMSASAITALMVRTANLRRTLTVLSEDVTN
jgi:hypothetical protein